jgi:hypothetical protein
MLSRRKKPKKPGIWFFSKISLRAIACCIELVRAEVHLIEKISGTVVGKPVA